MSQDNALQMDLFSLKRITAANVFFLIEKQIRHLKSLIYDCADFHECWFAPSFT